MHKRERLHKASLLSIFVNMIQIIGVVAIALLVLLTDIEHQSTILVELIICLAAAVIIWGAVVDIGQARTGQKMAEQADMLEAAYGNLEALNVTLRAQRHDFMNHLQVVGGLIEMSEYDEAEQYIERIYGDIESVSRALKTGNAAINALLKVKLGECQARGIFLDIKVHSRWENLPIEGWEMCRVLGNLIDNAMDVLTLTREPRITVSLDENNEGYCFSVENNGPMLDVGIRETLFEQGITTKGKERGMGLFIVREILKAASGRISVASTAEHTIFDGFMPFGQNMEGERVQKEALDLPNRA